MALYRVQSNGKAPTGLQAGDEVVTGGGTYRILGVNADGSYRSALSNQQQTIYNYRGSYGVPAARAAQQPVQDLSGVSEAKAALARVQAAKPGAYASRWEGQLQELYDRIAERGDFSYDLGRDPMYRQAREQYQTAGRLAMQDTMGQAAALELRPADRTAGVQRVSAAAERDRAGAVCAGAGAVAERRGGAL